MRRFLIRRFAFTLVALIALTLIVFGLPRVASDPLDLFFKPEGYGMAPETLEALKTKLGLDRPLAVQYLNWLRSTLTGDLGRSIANDRLVKRIIVERVGATVQLGLAAWFLATATGIPLGVLSAVKRGTPWDYIARGFALFGQALPVFWIGIVGIYVFAVQLDWLPSATRPVNAPIFTQIKHFILPTLVLSWLPAASYLRLTRSAMLDVLDSEFIKLAHAKGLSSRTVIWKHAFRNALIQPLTVSALVLAGFITGTVIVETVFAWPGLGRLAVDAVRDNDFPVLSAVVLIFMGVYVLMNLLADIAYAYVDPRIRFD